MRRPPRARCSHSPLSAEDIVKESLTIAGDLCIYTNQHHVIEVLTLNRMCGDSERFDVVIAGAGLLGLALAIALARAGLRVAVVDRAPIAAPVVDDVPYDLRVYAISPGSAQFLHGIGAWQRCPSIA